MKMFFRIILIYAVFAVLVASSGFAADKKEYSASPPEKIANKWRIGYLEGGPYKDYLTLLTAITEALSKLGWIEKLDLPAHEDESDTAKLWEWLAANAKSSYMEFGSDTYYSCQWDEKRREENKKLILSRLNKEKDIDLMLAMGTWAGQDLANNDHSVPTAVCNATDALRSQIIKSIDDSGYDHVHARIDPTRFERQIRAFHDVIGFKKLGMAFEDNLDGRSYAAIEDVKKVAKERNFEISECYIRRDVTAGEADMIACAKELATKTDAFYITVNTAVNASSLPRILDSMNAHKVATFSQSGADEVRRGVLLSVAPPDLSGLGKFHAEVIGKIINGAKPRELGQIYEEPIKLAFNAATAMIIGLSPEKFEFLSNTADVVYEKIEK
jgi:ABC-type uncharacterized transport system substrate-binding protein